MILQITLLVTVIAICLVFFVPKLLKIKGMRVKNIRKLTLISLVVVVMSSTTALAMQLLPFNEPEKQPTEPTKTLEGGTPSITRPSLPADDTTPDAAPKTQSTQSSETNTSTAVAPPTTSSSPTPPKTTTPSSAPSTPSSPTQPTSPWSPDMTEDFSAPLLASRWNIRNNTYSSNEDSYLLSRNVAVSAGALKIQGKLESAGGRNYTSGYIDTIGKYSLPTYFKAEIRAKVPMQQGMWAAPLWLRPEGGGDGEIDLIESLGSERANPKIHQTIHTEYGATHKQSAVTTNFSSVSSRPATDWHVYTIEKTKGKMVMWVDGIQTAKYDSSNPTWYSSYYETSKRWNLRVNLQIGGTWGGLPDGSTNWSGDNTSMQLDYIHTWTLK